MNLHVHPHTWAHPCTQPIVTRMSVPPDHTTVANLRNLGPSSAQLLAGIDVHTAGDIRHLGIPLIMHILKQRGTPASMNLAYALHAGLEDTHWLDLDPETKAELRAACLDT